MIRCTLALMLVAALVAHAAPGIKEKEAPLPPISAAMRNTALNNLKNLGLAMHNYHDVNGTLPTNTLLKDGKAGLSWRVLLLPYLEEDNLYKQFKLDEPWDSSTNIKLVEKLPKFFKPVRGRVKEGETFLQMFSGKDTLLGEPGKGLTFNAVTDGLSNTLMVVEGATPVIWTKPDDIAFDGKDVPKLGGSFDGDFNVLFGDGSVLRVPGAINVDVLKSAITRSGGEVSDLRDAIKSIKK